MSTNYYCVNHRSHRALKCCLIIQTIVLWFGWMKKSRGIGKDTLVKPTGCRSFSVLKGDFFVFNRRFWGFQFKNNSSLIKKIMSGDIFTIKIEHVAFIWMFECAMNFWAWNGKIWSFWLLSPNLRELGSFHPYFVCKCSFREISRIIIVILDQNKPIWLIFKIPKSEIQKSEICKLQV